MMNALLQEDNHLFLNERNKSMSYVKNVNPLKPYSRGVSIIGVGATPFMLTMDNKETRGLTHGELFGYAAIEAMRDAGITAKDVDMYVHGNAGPGWQEDMGTPNMHVANWFGMKAKPSVHHSEACGTGYVALEQAVSYVASGAYDIVLTGCCDFSYSIYKDNKHPSFMRKHCTDVQWNDIVINSQAKDYTMWQHCGGSLATEAWLDRYVVENKIEDKIEDVLMTLSKYSRENAARNPYSVNHTTYDDMAKMFKMESAEEFLRSKYNPKLGRYMHASHFEVRADGAAAAIVCPTEMAYKFTDRPVEVLGIGHSCLEQNTPALEKFATEAAYHNVRELTGLTGKDIDLFTTNDFFQQCQFLAPEECEYIPRGEGWQYVLDGRLQTTGDRPVNTHGGRCCYGHAHGTSGMHDLYETIMQMRGERGENQVQHPINYAMIRGFGGSQNVLCTILKNNAKEGK